MCVFASCARRILDIGVRARLFFHVRGHIFGMDHNCRPTTCPSFVAQRCHFFKPMTTCGGDEYAGKSRHSDSLRGRMGWVGPQVSSSAFLVPPPFL
mmetsp:Transcript_4439/g.13450  ORF Transcript_4439/g.13450 Transcript_4439/m.13450 type:complete len:96 (-) Transcript_4439:300-587(-)